MGEQSDHDLVTGFLDALHTEFDRSDHLFVRTWISGEVEPYGWRSAQAAIRFTTEDGTTLHAKRWTARDLRRIVWPADVEEVADEVFSGEIDEPIRVHHVDADGVRWLCAE